jgi:uncharacterized cysteine cluster protein YcgN (CxxCxxCC family)
MAKRRHIDDERQLNGANAGRMGRARGAAMPYMHGMDDRPFWQTKTLAEMSKAEWESLCDGCGRCCLNKLEDMDTGEIAWTDIACKMLDGDTCRCRDYRNRRRHVPDCIQLDHENVGGLAWLPPTCAYRLLDEGHDLYWWHPLVSGDAETVHRAGVSVRGRTVSEKDWPADELIERMGERVVAWPGKRPRRRKDRR